MNHIIEASNQHHIKKDASKMSRSKRNSQLTAALNPFLHDNEADHADFTAGFSFGHDFTAEDYQTDLAYPTPEMLSTSFLSEAF